ADQQGSPAHEIAVRLMELGASVSYHDPHAPGCSGRPLSVVALSYGRTVSVSPWWCTSAGRRSGPR
ncbi:hypothetical protein, partial [Streptomyces sp. NPDC058305]|uniref:hypothetical protein n=1 Tax=Streptomyces sp. NPDC058305 TaxID=3346438 RepID=UPI0036E023A8